MTIRYVKVKRPDTDEIKQLIGMFCEETGGGQEALDNILLRLPNMKVCIALEGVNTVGIGGYYTIGDKAIFDFTYVLEPYRNRGAWGRIHAMGVKDARSLGMKKSVIFVAPIRAKHFLKLGYKEVFHVLERQL